ncbi:hypothetical protein [Vibrio harveyi]|uniref:hypothetical protein n=1 Tax=Vibrio harveyi TaxID=669 RepID=UPI0023807C6D|nr:hypothetical protein [Vibrio harveyi]
MTQNEELREAYLDILKGVDNAYVIPYNSKNQLNKNLSGLFLTSIHPNYGNAKNKIMIIGRETRDWKWNETKDVELVDKTSCVDQALKSHHSFFFNQLKKKNSRGKAFHNFTRSVGEKSGTEGLIYSNLFCFALNKTIPTKSSLFEEILHLSEQLLLAQIKILKPDIILFVNGFDKSSVAARRQIFPIEGENNVCINRKDYFDEYGISNKQLWSFDLKFDNRLIKSYRTYHPSAVSKKAKVGRDFLISLLPNKDTQ